MCTVGDWLRSDAEDWSRAIENAHRANGWFTPEFIELATANVATQFLTKEKLDSWVVHYNIDDNIVAKNIGIVMAGNIPLVGFHDFLAVFVCGHRQTIKSSSKDDVLLKCIVDKMIMLEPEVAAYVSFQETLKGCDAYIATGSNNSARYFEQYFSKYPHIIRRNRTSVAILSGKETAEQLEKLADDVYLYFGLGCRSVSKIFVPEGYDFVPLIKAFDKYKYLADHNKYKNNYDYQLSIILLNNIYYMTNGSILLTENKGLFSPISHLYYEYYNNLPLLKEKLASNDDLQCIAGSSFINFGESQSPGLFQYADGVDTMQFLLSL